MDGRGITVPTSLFFSFYLFFLFLFSLSLPSFAYLDLVTLVLPQHVSKDCPVIGWGGLARNHCSAYSSFLFLIYFSSSSPPSLPAFAYLDLVTLVLPQNVSKDFPQLFIPAFTYTVA